ncbi:Acetyl esterase/lipase [Quadrisphaera granulorum]|uniref:Acetyl esterase/lipase n=2 Tax=Quadrisphaera granulorum TaxID=317664 RepID=A0A316A8E4_9ACTN|nr:acetyl esterase/lipase [Quadrisphaera granulorum]SZE96529.1 Acetyl esterase/lipase [Quadrisphaera granulorum]
MRLLHFNRTFVTEQGAHDRIREATLRPAAYGPPRSLRRDVRVDVVHDRGWPVYTLTPTSQRPAGGVVYAHGGGWVNEIVSQQWRLAAAVAAGAGVVVIVPIYPLVPYGTAGPVRDRVAELVRESTERYGPTGVLGDSAGGQIVLSAALALRDRGLRLPITVLVSPALDLTWSNPLIPVVQPSDPWLATPGGRVLADAWRGDLPITDPAVSPLFGDLAGLGPLTVFTGMRDVLNPDARLLVEKARAAGVEVELHEAAGQLHNYPVLPTAPGRAAQKVLISRVARGLGPPCGPSDS